MITRDLTARPMRHPPFQQGPLKMKQSPLDPIVIRLMELEIGLAKAEENTATPYQAVTKMDGCDPEFEVRNALYSARTSLQLARKAVQRARQRLEAPDKVWE